jgi:hypothetical protein
MSLFPKFIITILTILGSSHPVFLAGVLDLASPARDEGQIIRLLAKRPSLSFSRFFLYRPLLGGVSAVWIHTPLIPPSIALYGMACPDRLETGIGITLSLFGVELA